jgi:hypothetical protein
MVPSTAVLTLALLCTLGSSPHVALLTDPPRFSARLVDEAAPPDYSKWSRDDLRREYDRLDRERPSVAAPIALMVTGGVAFIAGLYLGLFSLILSTSGSATTLLIITAVTCLAGIGLLLCGVVLHPEGPERHQRADGRHQRAARARRPARTGLSPAATSARAGPGLRPGAGRSAAGALLSAFRRLTVIARRPNAS